MIITLISMNDNIGPELVCEPQTISIIDGYIAGVRIAP